MTTLTNLRQLALTNSGYNPALDSASVSTLATAAIGTSVYATINDLPNSNNDSGDQALVQSNDRYYIWTDSSWRPAGLINRSPVISLSPASSIPRYNIDSTGASFTITLSTVDSEGFPVTILSALTDSNFDAVATVSQDSSVFTFDAQDSAISNSLTGSGIATFRATDGINISSVSPQFYLTYEPFDDDDAIIEHKISGPGSGFGESVGISGDGNYAITNARYFDLDYTDDGAFFVYKKNGKFWNRELGPAGVAPTATNKQLGYTNSGGPSLALNYDGTYAVIGSYNAQVGGAAYIFVRSGSTWTQQAQITASDAAGSDRFGTATDISADGLYVIVGAYLEDTGLGSDGSAYIFKRTGTSWAQEAIIRNPGPTAISEYFGTAVSISDDGTRAIISAMDDNDAATDAGTAYIFKRTGTSWAQEDQLLASDAQASDRFGIGASISGDGNYAVVGAYQEDGGAGDPTSNVGAVYVFVRSGSTWTQQARLNKTDSVSGNGFGYSVSINKDGSTIVVGEPFRTVNGVSNSGRQTVFNRSGSSWTETAETVSSTPASSAGHGRRVSISDDGRTFAVGGYAIFGPGYFFIYEAPAGD